MDTLECVIAKRIYEGQCNGHQRESFRCVFDHHEDREGVLHARDKDRYHCMQILQCIVYSQHVVLADRFSWSFYDYLCHSNPVHLAIGIYIIHAMQAKTSIHQCNEHTNTNLIVGSFPSMKAANVFIFP